MLYIIENFRRKGFGKILLDSAIELSKELKYNKIRLDTLESMRTAIKLYESYGFKDIAPYRFNPIKGARYFELILS